MIGRSTLLLPKFQKNIDLWRRYHLNWNPSLHRVHDILVLPTQKIKDLSALKFDFSLIGLRDDILIYPGGARLLINFEFQLDLPTVIMSPQLKIAMFAVASVEGNLSQWIQSSHFINISIFHTSSFFVIEATAGYWKHDRDQQAKTKNKSRSALNISYLIS